MFSACFCTKKRPRVTQPLIRYDHVISSWPASPRRFFADDPPVARSTAAWSPSFPTCHRPGDRTVSQQRRKSIEKHRNANTALFIRSLSIYIYIYTCTYTEYTCKSKF